MCHILKCRLSVEDKLCSAFLLGGNSLGARTFTFFVPNILIIVLPCLESCCFLQRYHLCDPACLHAIHICFDVILRLLHGWILCIVNSIVIVNRWPGGAPAGDFRGNEAQRDPIGNKNICLVSDATILPWARLTLLHTFLTVWKWLRSR